MSPASQPRDFARRRPVISPVSPSRDFARVAVSVLGASLFGNQYPDSFGTFSESFMTLFRIAGPSRAGARAHWHE